MVAEGNVLVVMRGVLDIGCWYVWVCWHPWRGGVNGRATVGRITSTDQQPCQGVSGSGGECGRCNMMMKYVCVRSALLHNYCAENGCCVRMLKCLRSSGVVWVVGVLCLCVCGCLCVYGIQPLTVTAFVHLRLNAHAAN